MADGQRSSGRARAEAGSFASGFGEKAEKLEEISWDEFFKNENGLAFLQRGKTQDGKESRFNKFAQRDKQR